jgi:hypothetical protein
MCFESPWGGRKVAKVTAIVEVGQGCASQDEWFFAGGSCGIADTAAVN